MYTYTQDTYIGALETWLEHIPYSDDGLIPTAHTELAIAFLMSISNIKFGRKTVTTDEDNINKTEINSNINSNNNSNSNMIKIGKYEMNINITTSSSSHH